MKKYELTSEFVTNALGKKLFRIRALVSFSSISKGDIGGYIEKEENLSHDGNAWVSGDAWVCGNARVSGDALVCGDARVCGNARVSGNAEVSGDALVCGNARVCGNAEVSGDALVCGDARVCGNARVSGDKDYACSKGFGRYARSTTFFRGKDGGLLVSCGCFYGTISEFRDKVKETHGDGKMAREYLMLADLMEYHFSEEDEE